MISLKPVLVLLAGGAIGAAAGLYITFHWLARVLTGRVDEL